MLNWSILIKCCSYIHGIYFGVLNIITPIILLKVHIEWDIERNSVTSPWLTLYKEVHFTPIILQQFLHERNPFSNRGLSVL
jgi:hypothetical protein